jgi:hypothetical protein
VAGHCLGIRETLCSQVRTTRSDESNRCGKPRGQSFYRKGHCLAGEEFDALIGRPGYHLCENGDLERREGSLVYVMVRQGDQALPMGE